jgi:hypothetical protein
MATKRWSVVRGEEIENPKIDAFIQEVIAIEHKHGLSIAHEDYHGAFVIQEASAENERWLNDAMDGTGAERGGPAPNADHPKTDWRIR